MELITSDELLEMLPENPPPSTSLESVKKYRNDQMHATKETMTLEWMGRKEEPRDSYLLYAYDQKMTMLKHKNFKCSQPNFLVALYQLSKELDMQIEELDYTKNHTILCKIQWKNLKDE